MYSTSTTKETHARIAKLQAELGHTDGVDDRKQPGGTWHGGDTVYKQNAMHCTCYRIYTCYMYTQPGEEVALWKPVLLVPLLLVLDLGLP